MMSPDQLRQLRDQHETWLMEQPGVVGSGIGLNRTGNPAIKVYANKVPPATRTAIVARFQGHPVEFEETGEVRPQA